MSKVRRIYVEKKPDYAIKALELKNQMVSYLGIDKSIDVRVLIRYDIENVSDETYKRALGTVFSEPPLDYLYEGEFEADNATVFSVEFLPGQFDQRADSAEQCLRLLNEREEPVIKSAVTYVISGKVTTEQIEKIKSYLINPVDSRVAEEKMPSTLITEYPEPQDVAVLDGFSQMNDSALRNLFDSLELAMTYEDFKCIQEYFSGEEKRDPTITEIKVLDTYWSDHCRHTTFSTELKDIKFEDGRYKELLENTYKDYLNTRQELYKGRDDKYISLMDIALIAMKQLKKQGKLTDQEESDEINACSIVVPVDVDGKTEEYLINFKNETHNHPTEIEPFGGAATCLGGAIRDPLSGRTYVYQAMRITGAADPTLPLDKTLEGKLPQRKIVTEAAEGYSSYGNQIGLATGYVQEIYHSDYVAKRMEIGAVIAAAPRSAVKRLKPEPNDVIILLGGRTGRDGLGGATGSSKAHTTESIDTCGAEVQKGNPPTERKIQRLFRRPEVSCLIKKCNDFGAGGVSVAIGELADGLDINLDVVPKKYAGLDGTELAISESQERMAVVIAPEDEKQFLEYAAQENLEAVKVAVVTDDARLVLKWRGKDIVNLSRKFLDTNGAHQQTAVTVASPEGDNEFLDEIILDDVRESLDNNDVMQAWTFALCDINSCSQKGLVERFDSSIGAASVLMPYGGRYQLTPAQVMAAKVPVMGGKSDAATIMSYGFDPYLSSWSPYHGAIYSVIHSVAKIVAAGGEYHKIHFTFQEYFKKMGQDASNWGQPFSALLGAYRAQMELGLASIGGKDSMSGTFNDINVPPTLVSFAVDVANSKDIISNEFKKNDSDIIWVKIPKDEDGVIDFKVTTKIYDHITKAIGKQEVISAYAPDAYGIAVAISKMAFGNKIGVSIESGLDKEDLFKPAVGTLLVEVPANKRDEFLDDIKAAGLNEYIEIIAHTNATKDFVYANNKLSIKDAIKHWTRPLENVFATRSTDDKRTFDEKNYEAINILTSSYKVAKPRVFIPVFPGTNCEYDSARAFEAAGADVAVRVFRNLNEIDIRQSVDEFANQIKQAQIVMFPGGFSAGDQPEGSAKFFATAFRSGKIAEAITDLLDNRDGLMLGICNGFQALIKLGLLPYGVIRQQSENSPTLTYNTIGRHISKMVYTKVVSDKSPWLKGAPLGHTFVSPASHGEGRFVAPTEVLKELIKNGQVATQYVDEMGRPTMDEEWNVNGSYMAIEGITSPDGRIFGKMAHAERRGDGVAKNIYGKQDMKLFESGVKYFTD